MSQDRLKQAWELLQQVYRAQRDGELDRAVELDMTSLGICPTAEAHTFLGWTYHFQGEVDDAILECKRAIEVDPDFGNPYNDIGAYLIALGRNDEAIPWLEQVIVAPCQEPRHDPYFNLGRAYYAKGMFHCARPYFQEALRIEPDYSLARRPSRAFA
jgi:Tfp pilus assembly protein PilF